jgi:hypothetical protein
MAANIFTGSVNNNTNVAGNWSLGVVPTISDGNIATWDATSPACTINATLSCNGFDFTGYTNHLTASNDIFCNGNATLSSSMTMSGSGNITFTANTCSITSNGLTWTGGFATTTPTSGAGNVAITFLDHWVVNGSVTWANSVSGQGSTINDFSLTFGGGFSAFGNGNRSLAGSCQLISNGTGSFTTGVNSWVTPPLEINTSGTITFTTRFYKRSGLFKYTSGTTQTNNCTFVFGSIGCTIDVNGDTSPSATTLSTTGINFWRLDTTGNVTHNVLSPIRIIDSHTVGAGNFNAGANIYNKGNLTLSANSGAALYNYYLDGTGTWSGSTSIMRCNVIINTSGTITFTSNIRFGGLAGATFTHISGSTVTAGSILQLGSTAAATNLDLAGINWETIQFFGTATTTLLSKLNADTINYTVSHTLIGAFGFETNNLNLNGADNITASLVNGVTYLVKQSLITNTPGFTRLFTAPSGFALLTLQYGATQDLANTSATRINSSGGQTIYTSSGTLTSTVNWMIGTAPTSNGNFFLLMF